MAPSSRLTCVFSTLTLLSQAGLSVVIQTRQTVTAPLGGDARFCCQLLQPKDVRQVTWQKLSTKTERDIASSGKYFGHRVNAEFADRVAFEDASLQNCSIVLRQVGEQDEGCYRCLFNIYPDGAAEGRTCLQLYELSEPLLHVSPPDPPSFHRVVRCRATGRPAPTITLSVRHPGLRLSNYSSVQVSNGNGTVTVHASALLSGSPLEDSTVSCGVRLPHGAQRHTSVTLPHALQSSQQGEIETANSETSRNVVLSMTVLLVLLLIFIIVIFLFIIRRRQKKNRNQQINNTPEKEAQRLTGLTTPSSQRASSQLKQRTPAPSTMTPLSHCAGSQLIQRTPISSTMTPSSHRVGSQLKQRTPAPSQTGKFHGDKKSARKLFK